MPKLIDYPRTNYTGAWELAEITDDTGGKCAIETAARKLNRKVSGSFKAIIGSSVKFGLITSKRDLLTTTTLFKRIKHAYDKQEELLFHREAFLTPPLFTQLCRKFRSRELPIQMLDIMLIREFNVEEINAPGVAKAFVEGCRMVGLLDEHNIVADIDALANKQLPRRELASPQPTVNTFRREFQQRNEEAEDNTKDDFTVRNRTGALENNLTIELELNQSGTSSNNDSDIPERKAIRPSNPPLLPNGPDAIASLFGLLSEFPNQIITETAQLKAAPVHQTQIEIPAQQIVTQQEQIPRIPAIPKDPTEVVPNTYQIQISGPGVITTLSITEVEDIDLAVALLEKIRRQLRTKPQ